MKNYTGDRTIDGVDVQVDGRPLPEYVEVRKYAGTGFEWTYEGPGPRQLAFAILFDHLGDAAAAERLTESFMTEIVANLANEWSLSSEDIEEAITSLA